jgi:hypothetical protein
LPRPAPIRTSTSGQRCVQTGRQRDREWSRTDVQTGGSVRQADSQTSARKWVEGRWAGPWTDRQTERGAADSGSGFRRRRRWTDRPTGRRWFRLSRGRRAGRTERQTGWQAGGLMLENSNCLTNRTNLSYLTCRIGNLGPPGPGSLRSCQESNVVVDETRARCHHGVYLSIIMTRRVHLRALPLGPPFEPGPREERCRSKLLAFL